MPLDDRAVTADELLAHARWVRRLARRLVRDPNTAADLEQQTWLAAVQRPPRRRTNLRAWLGRVLRRRHLDHARGERRRARREDHVRRPEGSGATDDLIARAETRTRVAQAVLELEEPYRTAILLRFVEDVPTHEIAARLDVPLNTVRTRVARGLARLRERLRDEYERDGVPWQVALLPIAGGELAPLPALSLGSTIVATTAPIRITVAALLLLLVGGVGFVGWRLLREDDAPSAGAPEAGDLRAGASAGADLEAQPRLVGTGAARPERQEAEATVPPVAEGAEVPTGVVAGLVRTGQGSPLPEADVILWDAEGSRILQRQRSAVDGTFHFRGITDDACLLVVHGPDGAKVSHRTNPGRSHLVVTLDVPHAQPLPGSQGVRQGEDVRPGVVAGCVLDDQGQPLQGVGVGLWKHRGSGQQAETDEEGRFAWQGLDDGTYTLTAYARGWTRVRIPVRSGHRLLEITLDRGPSISGIVLEEGSEHPVAGMRVCALGTTPGVPLCMVQTSEDGTFLLSGLAQGEYLLEVGVRSGPSEGPAGDYAAKRVGLVPTGTKDLRVDVVRGLSISGVVFGADGRPVTRACRVRASPVADDGTIDYAGQRGTATTEGGAYRLRGLLPGRHDLTVIPGDEEDEDGQAAVAHVRGVAAGTTGLRIDLPAGVPITGRLVDEDGAPIEGKGWVWISPAGTPAGAPGTVAATLLEGGRFRSDPLDPGRAYDIDASGFGAHRSAVLQGVHPGDADIVLELVRGLSITGRVVLPDGTPPPAGVPVQAIARIEPTGTGTLPPWSYARAVTSPSGGFVLGGLKEVPYRLVAGGGSSGYVAKGAQSGVTPGETEDVVLRVRKGVPFSGRLVDATGEALVGVFLQLRSAGPGRAATARTGPDGRFVFAGVAAGENKLFGTVGGRFTPLGSFDAPAQDVVVEAP